MLILVRHGQSQANAAGLLCGRLDSPLTDLGREQASRLGNTLAAARLDRAVRVLCSPLARTTDTAEAICAALGVEAPEVDGRLVEIDYGVLDGARLSDVPNQTWATWRADPAWHVEGGESLACLQARVEELLVEITPAASASDVVAVTHVSPIKAAAAWAIGAGPELAWRLSLGVASITRLAMGGRLPCLVTFGETSHLTAP